jgi:hypothetical protein
MKTKKNNSALALGLQITLGSALILSSAILMASSFKSAWPSSGPAPASSSVFANVTGPIGVAAAPGQLIVSEYCTGNLDTIDDLGNVSLFTSIPGYPGGCNEMYLAISPALGTWAPNDIYATLGNLVYKIPPSGSPVTLFATLPSGCGPDRSGITFDHVGTFGNDMIVTCLSGAVWRVNSAGVPTFVASTNTLLEGPAIPPLSFGPVGGQILATDEISGTVWAISNAGVVTTPFSYPSAESVHVIPPNPCSFGNSNGALFSSMYGDNQIWKWPPSDLAGLGGNVLVTSEFGGGIGLVTFNGSSYVITQFSPETGQHEGSAIVDCEVAPTPTPTPTPTPAGTCPLTQGYWKNHPGAWPVTSLTLGSQNYTQSELLMILNTPVRGDASLILADQLIAAKLSIANGSDPTPVSATITAADNLLSTFNGKLPYHVKPSSTVGQQMTALAATLDSYNNGLLTPGCGLQTSRPRSLQRAPRSTR